MPKGTPIDGDGKRTKEERQADFLAALEECPSHVAAAQQAGMTVQSHYHWMATDPTYPARYEDSRRKGFGALEDVIVQRAKVGTKKLVVQKGEPVTMIKRDPETNAPIMVPAWDLKTGKPILNPDGSQALEPARELVYETEFDHRLAQFLLTHNKADRYTPKAKLEVTATDGLASKIKAARKRLKDAGATGATPAPPSTSPEKE